MSKDIARDLVANQEPPTPQRPTPRRYQEQAISALRDALLSGASRGALVVMPTGTGKSLVIGGFAWLTLHLEPSARFCVVSHVQELVEQDHAALKRMWPEAPAGIYCAGLGERDIDAQILFASIQSIYRIGDKLGRVDYLLIDEAHMVPRDDNSMYRRLVESLKETNPDLKIGGFTATPFRTDSGPLIEDGDDGSEALFDRIAYEVKLLDMIEQRFLTPIRAKHTTQQMDVSGVKTRGGDFIQGDLERAVDTDPLNEAIVSEIIERGAGRKSWLIFCSGVDHAAHVRDKMREFGVSCETVTGDTPSEERARILADFKSGALKSVTNVNVLTTGFDAPNTDLIALLRPTQSVVLYVQMLGRGMRLADNKQDALVLDFAGNVRRHGPVDTVTCDKKAKSKGDAPVKVCPECHEIVAANTQVCACGFVFLKPQTETKLVAEACTLSLLSNQQREQWHSVLYVNYWPHSKPGSPGSVCVTYHTQGGPPVREFFCPEHPKSRFFAERWWKARTALPFPNSAQEALQRMHTLRKPKRITVARNGKFWNVGRVDFGSAS